MRFREETNSHARVAFKGSYAWGLSKPQSHGITRLLFSEIERSRLILNNSTQKRALTICFVSGVISIYII